MALDISQFLNDISDSGYLKPNRYDMLISLPNILTGGQVGGSSDLNNNGAEYSFSSLTKTLQMRINATVAPGIEMLSVPVARYGVGTTQHQPYNAKFTDIPITFICDADGSLWQFWYNWMRGIFEFTDSSPKNDSGDIANYWSNYKDDYTSPTIQLTIYNQEGDAAQVFKLQYAYPTKMSEVPLSWDDNNRLLLVTVILTFKQFIIVNTSVQ